MKKVLLALTVVAFLGGTTMAATTFEGDPVKTEKKEGDEKKKKKKKKAKTEATATAGEKKSCSKTCTKTCTKKKEEM